MKKLMLLGSIVVSVNSLMAVNYYSAKSGDWNSQIWTLNPDDKNTALVTLPETLGEDDRLIIRHYVKYNSGSIVLGEKIRAPMLVDDGAKLEIAGNLQLKNYYLSNECKIEIHKNLYLSGNSNICGFGDLHVGGQIKELDESYICSTIPLELDYFKATAEGNQLNIEWFNASPIEDLKFELQKSLDGNNFETLGILETKNDTKSRKYTLKDENLIPETEVVYYRLKQTDNHGRFNFSEIIFADLTNKTAFVD